MKKRDVEALHRLAKRVRREVEKGNEGKAAKLVRSSLGIEMGFAADIVALSIGMMFVTAILLWRAFPAHIHNPDFISDERFWLIAGAALLWPIGILVALAIWPVKWFSKGVAALTWTFERLGNPRSERPIKFLRRGRP